MILRLERARVLPNGEARVFELVRASAANRVRPRGLEAVYIARKLAHGSVELVAISVWDDLERLIAGIGPHWEQVQVPPGLEGFLEDQSVEHLETVVAGFEDLALAAPA
jgi:hypothetical protein